MVNQHLLNKRVSDLFYKVLRLVVQNHIVVNMLNTHFLGQWYSTQGLDI